MGSVEARDGGLCGDRLWLGREGEVSVEDGGDGRLRGGNKGNFFVDIRVRGRLPLFVFSKLKAGQKRPHGGQTREHPNTCKLYTQLSAERTIFRKNVKHASNCLRQTRQHPRRPAAPRTM